MADGFYLEDLCGDLLFEQNLELGSYKSTAL